jgi:hypothetical protein
MGLGQGWDSSGRGAVFSIFFKALNIELKIQNSSFKVAGLGFQVSGFKVTSCEARVAGFVFDL